MAADAARQAAAVDVARGSSLHCWALCFVVGGVSRVQGGERVRAPLLTNAVLSNASRASVPSLKV